MTFRTMEEREAYAEKVSKLTDLGWAFYMIGKAITENPDRHYDSYSRDFRRIDRENILKLLDLQILAHEEGSVCRLILTEKGKNLLPKYIKAANTYMAVMNDY